MSNNLYLLISIVNLILSILMFKRVIGSFDVKKINMISWMFYYSLIGQSFIASVFVVLNLDDHYAISRVGDDARLYGWMAVQYTLIALPAGMFLALIFSGYNSNNKLFEKYIASGVVIGVGKEASYFKICLLCLSVLSLFSVAYTLAMLETNPLLAAINGFDAVALAGLRQQADRGFLGDVYIRNIFAINLTPILTYVAYAYWKKSGNSLDKNWFYILFAGSFFILTYDLAKSPFVNFILGFLFLNILLDGGVSSKAFNYFMLFAFILIVGAYYLVMDSVNLEELLSFREGIGGRILFSQAAGTYFSFEYFPQTVEFIGLSSFSPVLSGIFGVGETDRMARTLMALFHPDAVADGLAGVMNSLFIAEAWANFGILGVVLAPLYVGFVVQILFTFFLKRAKTPLMLGLLAHLSLNIPITGGLNDFIYNPGILMVFGVFGFLAIVTKLIKFV